MYIRRTIKKAKTFEAQEKRALKEKSDDVVSIHRILNNYHTDKVQMEKEREDL